MEKRELYKLDKGMIDAYLDAKAENDFMQLRGVKLTIAMEMLKTIFTQLPNVNMRQYIIIKDTFEKLITPLQNKIKTVLQDRVDKDSRAAIYKNINALNSTSFADLLLKLCDNVNLKTTKEDVKLFVECRNKLIHEGQFYCLSATPEEIKKCKPLPTSANEYFFLLNFVDKIFLKLFGYSGSYIDWSKPGKSERERLF